MRTIGDADGRLWDVAVTQASYGLHYLVFASRQGDDVRKSALAASTSADAEQELGGLSDSELLARLQEAEPWAS